MSRGHGSSRVGLVALGACGGGNSGVSGQCFTWNGAGTPRCAGYQPRREDAYSGRRSRHDAGLTLLVPSGDRGAGSTWRSWVSVDDPGRNRGSSSGRARASTGHGTAAGGVQAGSIMPRRCASPCWCAGCLSSFRTHEIVVSESRAGAGSLALTACLTSVAGSRLVGAHQAGKKSWSSPRTSCAGPGPFRSRSLGLPRAVVRPPGGTSVVPDSSPAFSAVKGGCVRGRSFGKSAACSGEKLIRAASSRSRRFT